MLRRTARMRCVFVCVFSAFVFSISLLSGTAQAYIPIRSSQTGATARWMEGTRITFRANVSNSSGLAASDIFSIFTTSLSRWKVAAFDNFSFTFYQGTDASRYPNYLGSPQDNSVFFTSNAASADQLPCSLIALTQLWFDPGSGIVNKADLRFNDKCYRFTMQPADTKSQARIYLGDVATHELGHALGLDHSQNLQSSMIFTAASEMSFLSCDDQVAMLNLYGAGARGRTGAITGRVNSVSGPVFGAHVNAISLERGVVLASALSDHNGGFRIDGLEEGHYALDVEPYYPGATVLGPYYSSINSSVCGGSLFQRTFAFSGRQLLSLPVSPGGSADAGTIDVKCQPPGSLYDLAELTMNSAPVIASANLAAPVATADSFDYSSHHYYKMAAQTGHLVAHALSYTLYSRAEIQVEFLDSRGVRLPQTSFGDVFKGNASGYMNHDAMASVDLIGAQDVYLHVFSQQFIPVSSYPSASVGVASNLYYALTVSRGTPAGAIYPDNARCETGDHFAAYVSEGEAPPFSSKQEQSSHSSGCGTIRNASGSFGGSDDDPWGSGGMTRLSNFGLVLLMLFGARSLMRRTS